MKTIHELVSISMTVEKWIELRSFILIHSSSDSGFDPDYFVEKIYHELDS